MIHSLLLNVLSSIDATRWKLVFYSIGILVLDGIHHTSPYDGRRSTGRIFFFVILALINILDLMHYLHASGVRGSRWSLREVRVARVRSRIQRSVEEGSGVENSACLAG